MLVHFTSNPQRGTPAGDYNIKNIKPEWFTPFILAVHIIIIIIVIIYFYVSSVLRYNS
jgi:hypothetical protein